MVSVIIPAHNEELCIRRTLDSVLASTHQNIEIIIVDDGSTDKTRVIVRDYIASAHSNDAKTYLGRSGRRLNFRRRYLRSFVRSAPIAIISQSNKGKGSALNNGIANHAHGKFIMCLDGDSILHPKAIASATAYFKDPKIIRVAANVRVIGGSWLEILQRFEHIIGYRSKKFYTLTNSEFIVGGVASTYRKSAVEQVGFYNTDTMTEDIGLSIKLVASYGNRDYRIVYGSDVIAMTEGVQTFHGLMQQRFGWKMGNLQNLFKYRSLIANSDHTKYSRVLTNYRLPMAVFSECLLLIEPILLGYIIYLSFAYHTFGILLGAYSLMTAYIFWNFWPDEHLSLAEKIRMSLIGFVMYFMFYVMDIIQLSSIIRCLISTARLLVVAK